MVPIQGVDKPNRWPVDHLGAFHASDPRRRGIDVRKGKPAVGLNFLHDYAIRHAVHQPPKPFGAACQTIRPHLFLRQSAEENNGKAADDGEADNRAVQSQGPDVHCLAEMTARDGLVGFREADGQR